jgi:Na+-driven multidrug efflux pump
MPYWKSDGRAMLRYTLPVALSTVVSVVSSSVDMLIVRHRLSDFESAGYYMLTRFSDVASYLGTAFIVFLFPIVSSRVAKAQESKDVLVKTLLGSMGSGLAVGLILHFAGARLLSLNGVWQTYVPLAPCLVWLCALNVFLMGNAAFVAYESACSRFRFLWYFVPLVCIKSFGLYAITGYASLNAILPEPWMSALEHFEPQRLSFVLFVFVLAQLLLFLFFIIDVFACRHGNR